MPMLMPGAGICTLAAADMPQQSRYQCLCMPTGAAADPTRGGDGDHDAARYADPPRMAPGPRRADANAPRRRRPCGRTGAGRVRATRPPEVRYDRARMVGAAGAAAHGRSVTSRVAMQAERLQALV